MTSQVFNKLLNERINKIIGILEHKATEYSSNDDRLHNFKAAALRRNITPERALDGMMLKHEISVQDIINNIDNNILPSKMLLNEKIGDMINYYILLEALITERITNNET